MKLIQETYVQKSNWFLYPLLGIKRAVKYKPNQTYIADVKKGISERDRCLVCVYNKVDLDKNFQFFEEVYLFNNFHFKDFYETRDFLVYIFDLNPFARDFDKFIQGKYSQYSDRTKAIINAYYAKSDQFGSMTPHPRINAFLNPNQEIYEQAAEEYGVPVETIKMVGEIFDKPSLFKETLFIEEEEETTKEEIIEIKEEQKEETNDDSQNQTTEQQSDNSELSNS